MPLASLITAVEHAPAVGRDLRAGPPARLFVHEALEVARIIDRNAAQVTGAVGDLAIRQEHQALAIRRPRGIDRVIVLRIVVARDLAFAWRDDRTRRAEAALLVEWRDEQLEMTGRGCRHVSEALAVGRKARLHGDGVRARELLRLPRGHIEPPQLDRLLVMTREDDGASVGRP